MKSKMKKPSFLMVLTGISDYAYIRPEDGILVVPVESLRNRIKLRKLDEKGFALTDEAF